MPMLTKIPFFESSSAPSQLNTSSPIGVASSLASMSKNEPSFDGVTIDDMRGNPLYLRCSDLDRIGLAQKKLAETGNIVSKSKFVRTLNKQLQHPSKPSK